MIDRVNFAPLPSVEFLRECFVLDPIEGTLTWKKRPIEHFKTLNAMNRFNTLFAGKIAGSLGGAGYLHIGINAKLHKIHRLIYFMYHGKCDMRVDHIDGNKLNNSVANLRLVSKYQNQWNTRLMKTNKSGVKGVCWSPSRRAWWAQCGFNGVNHKLGYFSTIEEATEVVRAFRESAHQDHANHGSTHV